MRKIIYLISVFLILIPFSLFTMPPGKNIERIITQIQLDSVKPDIENKPFIFFTAGHHGYNWAILVKSTDTFMVYSGSVPSNRGSLTSKDQSGFDSLRFFSSNKACINWALDTLLKKALRMTPIINHDYNPMYSSLSIYNSEGERLYHKSSDIIGYTGANSTEFNEKLQKLWFIMFWLSAPAIRQNLSDSIIF